MLQYDGTLSNVAFKFDLRRYSEAARSAIITTVGRCRLTLTHPC